MKAADTGGDVLWVRANCFVRAEPRACGAPLALVRRGEALARAGETAPGGWLAVTCRGGRGWVSGGFVWADTGNEK